MTIKNLTNLTHMLRFFLTISYHWTQADIETISPPAIKKFLLYHVSYIDGIAKSQFFRGLNAQTYLQHANLLRVFEK